MKINIIDKGFELSDTQQRHFEKKLQKLDRFFGDEVECTVRVRQEKSREIVEITLPLRGGVTLRAQESTHELYASLDAVMEKIMRQIRRQRTKLEKRTREGAYAKAEMENLLTTSPEEQIGKLIRTKSFQLDAMTTEEAISQMEMLGHSFFLFLNQQTNSVCAVYAREDGNFGLLIPEIA